MMKADTGLPAVYPAQVVYDRFLSGNRSGKHGTESRKQGDAGNASTRIEREIDRLDNELPKMRNVHLAGRMPLGRPGTRVPDRLPTGRTPDLPLGRDNCPVEEPVLVFMNRLSDYLFVLARKECINNNGKEIIWDYTCV